MNTKRFFKTNSSNINPLVPNNTAKSIDVAKRRMSNICHAFCIEPRQYRPEITIRDIRTYIDSSEVMNRLLYSEISNSVFSLNNDEQLKSNFETNLDSLLNYALNSQNGVPDDCKKMAIKIYDHYNLTTYQTKSINKVFAEGVEDTKNTLYDEFRGIQKDYITILGIFSSVILAFIGGVTFSTSVFENIHKATSYRIVFISAFLGLIVLNSIRILLRFLMDINNKNSNNKKVSVPILFMNICIIAVMIITGLLWLHERYNILSFILKN